MFNVARYAVVSSIILTAIYVVFGASKAPAAGEQNIAFLTNPHGMVQIKRHGAGQQFAQMKGPYAFLRSQDVVRSISGGRANIWQINRANSRVRFKTGTEVIRPLSTPQGNPAVTVAYYERIVFRYLRATQQAQQPSPTTAGGTDEDRFWILSPRREMVLTGQPTFSWVPLTGATRYSLIITDENENIKFQKEIEGGNSASRFTLSDAEKLAPGKYSVEIVATVRGAGGREEIFRDVQIFTIASAEQAQRVRNDLSKAKSFFPAEDMPHLLYIEACIQNRIFSHAETEIIAGLRRNPQDQGLHSLLMQVYWETKRWEDREKVRKTRSLPQHIGVPIPLSHP